MAISHDIIALSVDTLHVVDATPKSTFSFLSEPGVLPSIITGILSFIGIACSHFLQGRHLKRTIEAERKREERKKERDVREGLICALSRFMESILLLEKAIAYMRERNITCIAENIHGSDAIYYHRDACQMYTGFNNYINDNRLFLPDSQFVHSIKNQWLEMQKSYEIENDDGMGRTITICETKEGGHVPFSQFLSNQIDKLETDPSIVKIPDYAKEI